MSIPTTPLTLGVILAGGLARRMGGGDKPFRMLGSRTLLDHVIERLRPQCSELILNANGDAARFFETGLAVVPDGVPDFAGPLAGILAALDWVAIHRPNVEWAVSAAADSPFLPHDFVSGLHAARMLAGTPLACARTGGRTHPVNGLWSVALRDDMRHALTGEDMRKIDVWTARHGIASADWPSDPFDPFFNVNTPDDLAEAERLFESHQGAGRYSNAV
jgi:molybdenum cofactor guanylyltransferase